MKPIFFHGLHQQLWQWIAEDPKNNHKSDWPHWVDDGDGYNAILFEGKILANSADCFGCEARHDLINYMGHLDDEEKYGFCPLMEEACCGCPLNCLDGLYEEFNNTVGACEYKKATEVAEKIANLPLHHSDRWEINTMRFDDVEVKESGN